MSQLIIIGSGSICFVIAIILLIVINRKENKKLNLLFLEYDYDKKSDNYQKIGVNFSTNKMKVYQMNNKSAIYKIPKDLNNKLNHLFYKYQLLDLKKSPVLLESSDTTAIHFEMIDGRCKHITREDYAECNDEIFSEIRKVLEKCLP